MITAAASGSGGSVLYTLHEGASRQENPYLLRLTSQNTREQYSPETRLF